jgi:hypothetical protein
MVNDYGQLIMLTRKFEAFGLIFIFKPLCLGGEAAFADYNGFFSNDDY